MDFDTWNRETIHETFLQKDYLEYLDYSFFTYEDKNIVVMYDENGGISKYEEYNQSLLTIENVNSIQAHDSIFDVVSKIGLPSFKGSYSEDHASLDFARSEKLLCSISFQRSDSDLLYEKSEALDKEKPSSWFDEDKKDLPTLKEAQSIKQGMSIDDVVAILGKPQRDVGSGAIIFEFDLTENKRIDIRMINNSTLENALQKENATMVYGTHYLYVLDTEIISL